MASIMWAAPPAVLMGHHFSSIAGAGPINGPIQASVFGWVPVFLWCIIGGIFFGGLQDFGSLFASIRHDGKSVGEIIKDSMGKRAQKLFIIFALLVLILVIASFVNVVAGTFFTASDADVVFGITTNPTGKPDHRNDLRTVYRTGDHLRSSDKPCRLKDRSRNRDRHHRYRCDRSNRYERRSCNESSCMDRICRCLYHRCFSDPRLDHAEPRDYLSSFLLYAMMILAVVGIANRCLHRKRTLLICLPSPAGIPRSVRCSRLCSSP